MMRKILPSFDEEKKLLESGYKFVIGIDEVGRGAFAGPIVAAAVVLPLSFSKKECLRDSKMLSAKQRVYVTQYIQQEALYFSITETGLGYINTHGIQKAGQNVFLQAVSDIQSHILPTKNFSDAMVHSRSFLLVDGFPVQGIASHLQKAIIKGDQTCASIAAASIIAKVYRDELMKQLHTQYPVYNWEQNKGYGTAFHREAIQQYGLSPLHRTSFDLRKYTKVK